MGVASSRLRVLIVDDHAVVVSGVRHLLTAEPGVEVIGAARSLADARQQLARRHADAILLELHLPDSDGLDTLRALRLLCPRARILVLTGQAKFDAELVRAGGADAALHKSGALEHIIAQLRLWLPSSGRRKPDNGELTTREAEICKLAAQGMTTPEISAALHVSRNTVKTHLSHIFCKLGVKNRAQLAHQYSSARGAIGSRARHHV